jgi:hypothetical protein
LGWGRLGDDATETPVKLSFKSFIMRRLLAWAIISVAVVISAFAYLVWRGLNEAATLQPGVVPLQLPSGATAYLHRQAYSGKPAEVYLSANRDICAPYDRVHDFKLPQVIQGGPESPVLISYTGNVILVPSPEPIQLPQ